MVPARGSGIVLAVILAFRTSFGSSSDLAAEPRRLVACLGAVQLGQNCTVTAEDLCILDNTGGAAVCAQVCDSTKVPSDYRISLDNEDDNQAVALAVEQARHWLCPESRQDTCPPGEYCDETPNGMCVVAGADGRECRDMCDYSYDPEDYTSGTAEGAASKVEDMRYSFIPGFSQCDNRALHLTLLVLLCCCCKIIGIAVAYFHNFRDRGIRGKRGLSQQRFDPVLDVPPASNGTADEVRAPMLEEPQQSINDTRVNAAYEAEIERFKEAEAQHQAQAAALETKLPQMTGVPQSPQQPSTVFPGQPQQDFTQQLTLEQPQLQQPLQAPALSQPQLQMPQMQPQAQPMMTPASAGVSYRQPLSQPLVSQASMQQPQPLVSQATMVPQPLVSQATMQQAQPLVSQASMQQPQPLVSQASMQQAVPSPLTQVVSPQYQQMLPPQYQAVQQQPMAMNMNPMATQPPAAFQTPQMASRQIQGGSYYYQ